MIFKQLFFSVCLACVLAGCGGGSSSANMGAVASSFPGASSISSAAGVSSRSAIASSLRSSASSQVATATLIHYGSDKMQLGELRLPQGAASAEAVPVVVIIHGGCWVSAAADYQFMDKFAQAITEMGYATWNIEYRALGTGGDWPVIFQDVSAAVDYLAILAQSYPLNLNKVAVIGHSAGGHLALWLAGRSRLPETSELYSQNPLSLRGVISLAGIANVTASNRCFSLVNNIIGVPITPSSADLLDRLQETSPLQMLPIASKTILISGSADTLVPPAMGLEYSARATALGDNSLHYILSGLGHFDLIEPATTDWVLYQQSLEALFKD